MYWKPPLHDFDTSLYHDRRVKKIADRFYRCRGVQVYIHHTDGLTPENKVRVAVVIQFGKYVVLQSGANKGNLCFYAFSGRNPFNLAGKKKIKKSDPKIAESTIPFDEGIVFEKNFYEMLWHYWSINVDRNINLVLLYLQLKEGVMPTIASSIDKALLEGEYDLLGYTSLRMHDDQGKIPYGRYKLPLYDGPIYIEDLREQDLNGGYITFTLGKFDEHIEEIPLKIKDEIAK